MPNDANKTALLALDREVDRTADELATLIKALRKQRTAAMRAGDPRRAASIGAKLSGYGNIMAELDRANVRKLDSAAEIQKLIAAFKGATADLKAARQNIEDTKAAIDKATKVVKVIAKIAKKALV